MKQYENFHDENGIKACRVVFLPWSVRGHVVERMNSFFCWIRAMGRGLLPNACRLCRAPLDWPDAKEKSGRLEEFFCPACLAGIFPLASPFCTRCGMPLSVGESHLCGSCLRHPPAFDHARAFCLYEGTMLKMVHAFKYAGKQELAEPLAFFLAQTWKKYGTSHPDRILPVPMGAVSMWKRGFNQAGLLAGAFVHEMGWDGKIGPVLDFGSLVKVRKTASQTGLGRKERKANVRNAFSARKEFTGEHILLVDDVLTTGATADACAKVIRQKGAFSVSVLTIARTP